MYLPRYIAFFLFLCLSKVWGRNIVWPPNEEYLESLFRDFPQTTAYPPQRSYPDPQTTAYPPPQRRIHASLLSRDPRLHSRLRSTTEHPSSSSHTDDPVHTFEKSQVSNSDNTSLPLERTNNESPSSKSQEILNQNSMYLESSSNQSSMNPDQTPLEGNDSNAQFSVAEYGRAAAHVVGPSNQSGPSNQQVMQSRYQLKPWHTPTRVNCRHVEKIVKVQQCEPYTMETCWTEAKQECYPQPVTNCTGMIDTRLEQVCFNVEDELCTLVETVEFEKSVDSYQSQHCFFGQEGEVCGSGFGVQKLKMDDYGCTSVNVLNCHQVAQYTHDIKRIESVEFDCKEDGYQPNTVLPRISCTPNPTEKVYKVPKKVVTEVCEVTPSRYCEAFVNNRAVPAAKVKCKPYIKKSCDFKIETSPKISKKFKYEKVCRKKSREICEHVETRAIVPKCETSERLSCVYVAHDHQCKLDPKHYCHLVDKVVSEEVCDTAFGYS